MKAAGNASENALWCNMLTTHNTPLFSDTTLIPGALSFSSSSQGRQRDAKEREPGIKVSSG